MLGYGVKNALPIDAGVVDGVSAEQEAEAVFGLSKDRGGEAVTHGLLNTEGKGSEEEGVDGCTQSLVQKCLDHNVAYVQLRLL